jgi:hypothetical protein
VKVEAALLLLPKRVRPRSHPIPSPSPREVGANILPKLSNAASDSKNLQVGLETTDMGGLRLNSQPVEIIQNFGLLMKP